MKYDKIDLFEFQIDGMLERFGELIDKGGVEAYGVARKVLLELTDDEDTKLNKKIFEFLIYKGKEIML